MSIDVLAVSYCTACGKRKSRYSQSTHCLGCAATAFPCVMAHEGCLGRVASWSKSRICSKHDSGYRAKYSHSRVGQDR